MANSCKDGIGIEQRMQTNQQKITLRNTSRERLLIQFFNLLDGNDEMGERSTLRLSFS